MATSMTPTGTTGSGQDTSYQGGDVINLTDVSAKVDGVKASVDTAALQISTMNTSVLGIKAQTDTIAALSEAVEALPDAEAVASGVYGRINNYVGAGQSNISSKFQVQELKTKVEALAQTAQETKVIVGGLTPFNPETDIKPYIDGIEMPQTDLTPVTDWLAALSGKIDGIHIPSVDLDPVRTALSDVGSEMERLHGIVTQADGKLDAIPGSLTAVNASLGNVMAKVDALQMPDLGSVSQKADAIALKIDSLSFPAADFTVTNTKIDGLSQKIDGLSFPAADFTVTNTKIDALGTKVDTLTAATGVDFAPIEAKIEAVSGKIERIQFPAVDLTGTDAKIEAVGQKIDGLVLPPTDLTGVNAKLDSISALVEQRPVFDNSILTPVTDGLSAIEGKIEAIQGPDLSPLQDGLSAIEGKIDGLSAGGADITPVTDALGKLSAKVDSLAADNTPAVLADSLERVEARVKAIERSFGSITGLKELPAYLEKFDAIAKRIEDAAQQTVKPDAKPDAGQDAQGCGCGCGCKGKLPPVTQPDVCITSAEVREGASRLCAYAAAKRPPQGENAESAEQAYLRIAPVPADADTMASLISESTGPALGALGHYVRRSSLTRTCWDLWLDIPSNAAEGVIPSVRQALADYLTLAVAGRWMLLCSAGDGKLYCDRAVESLKAALSLSFERKRPQRPA